MEYAYKVSYVDKCNDNHIYARAVDANTAEDALLKVKGDIMESYRWFSLYCVDFHKDNIIVYENTNCDTIINNYCEFKTSRISRREAFKINEKKWE